MSGLEYKPIDVPDETRTFDHGKVDVAKLGGHSIGRVTLEPGWKWSECVKPIVGTDSCQVTHIGFVVSGRLGVVMDDGTEFQLKAGDAYCLPAGHDAWVEGNDVYQGVEFETLAEYAKPRA